MGGTVSINLRIDLPWPRHAVSEPHGSVRPTRRGSLRKGVWHRLHHACCYRFHFRYGRAKGGDWGKVEALDELG